MNIFRSLIEKQLSTIFGAEVTFSNLKISIMKGSLEAEGLTVGSAEFDKPLLKVRRIRAEISVSKALSGRLAIKSIAIEEPIVKLVVNEKGGRNFPSLSKLSSKEPQPGTPVPSSPSAQPSPARQLNLHSIQVTNAQLHFCDQTGGSTYHASAENVQAELREEGGQTLVKISIGSIGRRDCPMTLAPIHLTASFASVGDLLQLQNARVEMKIDAREQLVATMSSPQIAARKAIVQLQAKANLSELSPLLPPSLELPPTLRSVDIKGDFQINTKFRIEGPRAIAFDDFHIQLAHARFTHGPQS
ncbi:MAG: AsmA family protein [Planctomycetota bacterium]|nr:AsmA family protein [Planctomycetota bacterium]